MVLYMERANYSQLTETVLTGGRPAATCWHQSFFSEGERRTHPIEADRSEIQKPIQPRARVKTVPSRLSCISYSESSRQKRPQSINDDLMRLLPVLARGPRLSTVVRHSATLAVVLCLWLSLLVWKSLKSRVRNGKELRTPGNSYIASR